MHCNNMYTDLSVLLWAQCKYGHNTEHTHTHIVHTSVNRYSVHVSLFGCVESLSLPMYPATRQLYNVYTCTHVYTKVARILKDNEILLCTYMYMYKCTSTM